MMFCRCQAATRTDPFGGALALAWADGHNLDGKVGQGQLRPRDTTTVVR